MNQHPLRHLVYATLLASVAMPHTVWGQAKAAPPIDGVIGKLQSFDGKSLDVQTPSGVVHVIVKQPLTTYKQIPSDLSHVAAAPYIGVASAEGADGKQVAKQIFIFPAELRGAAEGSVLADPPGATSHSRMTNGTVSRPSHSRMTKPTGCSSLPASTRCACAIRISFVRVVGSRSGTDSTCKEVLTVINVRYERVARMDPDEAGGRLWTIFLPKRPGKESNYQAQGPPVRK